MTRPGIPNAAHQTKAYQGWKDSLEALDEMKRRHAQLASGAFLHEFAEILKPFEFKKGRQFKIDWTMGSLSLDVYDHGKLVGTWLSDGTAGQHSKFSPIYAREKDVLFQALSKVLSILGGLHNDEDEFVLIALDGKFIEVNNL